MHMILFMRSWSSIYSSTYMDLIGYLHTECEELFNHPLLSSHQSIPADDQLRAAHEKLFAKKKLTNIIYMHNLNIKSEIWVRYLSRKENLKVDLGHPHV